LKYQKFITILRILPLLLIAVLTVGYFCSGQSLTPDSLLHILPDNLFLAAVLLIVCYALKSLSVFFPITLLYLAACILFAPPAALFVNLLGILACITVPYWIGVLSGSKEAKRLLEKYPKLVDKTKQGDWFISYFLRIISCLPGDIVSLYLGTIRVFYPKYLLGSVCGMLPGMVAITLMGSSIATPGSPLFLCSAAAALLLAGGSFLLRRRIQKQKHPASSDR
jgi:uncharacterized membrane protein YdjX (TVP38/TMEM64 family)